MGLFSFRSTPKPRRFNHIPIYWDPEKEKREEREAAIEKELHPSISEYKPSIKRGSFRKYSERLDYDKKKIENLKMRIKLLLALVLLIILALYIALYGNSLFSLYFESGI